MAEPTVPGNAVVQSHNAVNAAPRRPSLLPAVEFSSPGLLPRPTKRKFEDALDDRQYYPTPVPTSSTGILPSSPPAGRTRPGLSRTISSLSERQRLRDVPSLHVPLSGEPLLMGRSSNSSDYQLSANRHISRVHVRASYHAPDSLHPAGKVEVECLGWNGARVHCRGEIVELARGECFVSDKPTAQVMVDVQDTRVMLVWPKEDSGEPPSIGSRSPWAQESPDKRRAVSAPQFASSPPPLLPRRPQSPISPTPANHPTSFTSTFRADQPNEVKVYEDHSSDEDAVLERTPEPAATALAARHTPKCENDVLKLSRSTAASDPEDLSEHDEENDPIVHSFGPFGEDILSRFQSFQSTSPERKRKPLKSTINSPGRSQSAPRLRPSPIKNHVVNQLAFSRVHSLPLSTIHTNLPAELRGAMAKPSDTENRNVLSTADLKTLLDDIPCVGEISREGKDAAGKLLESEFYYMPEMDVDQMRRDTVTQSLGKTSIRAARKQHKVWHPPLLVVHDGELTHELPAILLEATAPLSALLRPAPNSLNRGGQSTYRLFFASRSVVVGCGGRANGLLPSVNACAGVHGSIEGGYYVTRRTCDGRWALSVSCYGCRCLLVGYCVSRLSCRAAWVVRGKRSEEAEVEKAVRHCVNHMP